jgi:hypothetical protein
VGPIKRREATLATKGLGTTSCPFTTMLINEIAHVQEEIQGRGKLLKHYDIIKL